MKYGSLVQNDPETLTADLARFIPKASSWPPEATMSLYIAVDGLRYFGTEWPCTWRLRPSSTRKRARKTGNGSSIGRHPPSGLALCSLYSAITASLRAWRSFLCWSCSFFSSGCSFCITSIDRVCLMVSGVRMIITQTVSMIMATA